VGYLLLNNSGTSATLGSLTRKNSGNTTVHVSNNSAPSGTGATNMGSTPMGTTPVFNDGTYNFTMTITRNNDDLQISANLTQTSGGTYVQTFTNVTHTNGATVLSSSFDAVAILYGGNLGADQASLSNVQVTSNTPEPACLSLLAFGAMGLTRRRRSIS